ncbi:MAG: ABC transporter ATP-binding protein/permease [Firmicutes bacterium]|nr:ABC transporter ATP-binding protein/permease [Bacillota bacterium]
MPGHGKRTGAAARPKNAKETVRRILGYMLRYRVQLCFVVLAIMVSAAAGVAGTYFLKPIINRYIVPWIGHENPDLSGLAGILCVMAAIYLTGTLCSWLYSRLMINIATGTLYRIRTDLFSRMERLSVGYFDKHVHGELMSRYTNDTDALREMLSSGVPQLISSAISVSGIFVMMLLLSPALTLAVAFVLFLMLGIIKYLGKKSAFYFKKQQEAIGKLNGYIEEMVEGQKVIKVFNHEEEVKSEFARRNETLRQAASNANTCANVLMPIMSNLSYILYAIVAALGAASVIGGRLDLGSVAAFLQYTRSFAQPVTQISQLFNSVLNALAGAERIFALIDEPSEEDGGDVILVNVREKKGGGLEETEAHTGRWAWKCPDSSERGGWRLVELRGDVRFRNVTFSYDGVKNVLKNVSLYAEPGQEIAFVGSTGAGKTTITNLLNRFYDINEGEITYDGIDLKRIRKADLRGSLAMVLQDTHLFTGTVRENIRYGNLEASDSEVEEAAKLANAHAFIQHLPQGYDTVLTADGANLSQGQRQLLAIARAAVADPPVLVLDEATSSIDTRTETLIQKGMERLMDGRTVFVIAHRLSTVRNADAILVLENGEIIERGSHEQLLQEKGKYYQLYTGMFELS